MSQPPHREPGVPEDISPDDPALPGILPADDPRPVPDPGRPATNPDTVDPTPPAPDPRAPGTIDLA